MLTSGSQLYEVGNICFLLFTDQEAEAKKC